MMMMIIIIIIIINTSNNQKLVYRKFSGMIWRQVPTRHDRHPETVVQFTLSKQIPLHRRERYILTKISLLFQTFKAIPKSRDVFYQQSVAAVKTEYVTAEPLITSHLDGGGKNGRRNGGKSLLTDEDECLERFTTVTLALLKPSYKTCCCCRNWSPAFRGRQVARPPGKSEKSANNWAPSSKNTIVVFFGVSPPRP